MVVALVLISLVVVVNTIQYNDGTQPTGEVASLMLMLAACIAVLGIALAGRGFWTMGARPMEGAFLVVGGSSVAGLAWYWLFAPVLVAIVVSVYGVGRARRLRKPGDSRRR
jgi:hypothetical protein